MQVPNYGSHPEQNNQTLSALPESLSNNLQILQKLQQSQQTGKEEDKGAEKGQFGAQED